MTRLLFVRHGAIDGLGLRIAGRGGGERLNRDGRTQVADLARQLKAGALAAIYSSPQARTLETAQALADRVRLEIQIETDLDEIDFGAWTGMSYQDLDPLPDWQAFNRVRSTTRIPAGELIVEAQNRAIVCAARLSARNPGGTIVLVSHGDVIRAALAYYLGAPLDFLQRFEISPASVSTVELGAATPRILAINEKRIIANGK